jgi:hypothetical protein
MSTEFGPGPGTNSGQPRSDQASGRQATADTPSVPRARTEQPPPQAGWAEPEMGYAATGRRARHRDGAGAAMGFTILAAVLMVMGGLWSFFTGLEAVLHGNFFVSTANYAYNINITGWGWIHIGIGAAVFLAGCALFAQQNWARFVGIFLAVASAALNFLFLPHYPLWSILVIALDVVIIWALSAGWRRAAY